jgi:hypothetical protein
MTLIPNPVYIRKEDAIKSLILLLQGLEIITKFNHIVVYGYVHRVTKMHYYVPENNSLKRREQKKYEQ